MRSYASTVLILILAVVLLGEHILQPTATVAGDASRPYEVAFGVTADPSVVVVKVGESVNVTITVTGPGDSGLICFSLQGFPESGFRTSFNPECASRQEGIASVLTVEATPAAAPQTFTALVVASSGSQATQATLNVTVEPAMPAWIPWLGLGLFFMILGVAVFWKPRLPFKRAKRSDSERKRRRS